MVWNFNLHYIIHLHPRMWGGDGEFRATDSKMTSTFAHSIEKKYQ